MLVYRTSHGIAVAESAEGPWQELRGTSWDSLFTGETTRESLAQKIKSGDAAPIDPPPAAGEAWLPPIESQEVWAAGVTYLRSRTARMEESAKGGASEFYDNVYNADRPELFFKATPCRCVGNGGKMTLRGDSTWMVPEPELTLAFNSSGNLIGYTVGNDLSSRDIEGENPLYLPQAKVFDACAALGPGLYLTDQWPSPDTAIALSIRRGGAEVFGGSTQISQMKQTFPNLQEYLHRHCTFPTGCYLMTGTGVVPDDDFTLQPGDEVAITIEPVGTLTNTMK